MANQAKPSSSRIFFRIIRTCNLKKGALELPEKFVKEQWENLSKHACLEVPTGVKSVMKLKKRNGRAYLKQGWEKFVEKYSIKRWYTLMFRHKGKSKFSVHICDWSDLEIEYVEAGDRKEADFDIKEEEGEDEDCPTKLDKHKKSKSGQKSSSVENNIQRETGVRSPNSFSVIMKRSYVSNGNRSAIYMHIPKDGVSYFQKTGKDVELTLKGKNGKVWSMKYHGRSQSFSPRIGSGWRDFAEDNGLKEGDKCTFEPVISTHMKFRVTIARATDEQVNKRKETGTKKQTNEVQIRKRKRSCSAEEESSFTATMTKTTVGADCRVNIPRAHTAKHLHDQHGKQVVLQVNGNTRPVKCTIDGSCQSRLLARFCSGWKEFVVENDLQVGDSCVFELCSKKPNRYNVTISRGAAGSSG